MDAQQTTPTSTAVSDVLASFEAIQPTWLRRVVTYAPYAIGLVLLIDWLIGTSYIVSDFLRLPGYLTILLEIVVISWLLDALPTTLKTLWQRGLINAEESDFTEYIHRFEHELNQPLSWVTAAIFGLGAVAGTYPLQVLLSGGTVNFAAWASSPFFVIGPILQIPMAFIAGALAWRYGVVSFLIGRLGQEFEIRVQPNHPDQSGGLKPLGMLTLVSALVIVIAALPLAGWLIFSQEPQFEVYRLWSGLFSRGIIILCIASVFFFLRPLYHIHLQMEAFRQRMYRELDELSRRMGETAISVISNADSIAPEEGRQQLESLKVMQQVYEENRRIPTWPFNWDVLLRLAAAEAIPLLSLTGLGGSLLDFIGPVIDLIF